MAPNYEPQDLPIRPRSAQAPECASALCVAVDVVPEGVIVRTTLTPELPGQPVTDGEWAKFITEVKAGAWDYTVKAVPASV